MFQNLLEITFPDQSPPVVDREAGVIHGVKVIGRKSRNNREYSPRAVSQLVPMYEGIRVNLNHPPPQETGRDRAFHDLIGTLRGPKEKDDGVYADLHLLKAHPYFGTVMEAAEHHPHLFGLSHNADGKVSSQNGKNVVDEIEKVRSVDIVQNPATNSGLFESQGNPMKKTIRQLLESKIWSSAVMRRSRLLPKPTVGMVARKLLEDADTMPYAEDEAPADGGEDDDSAVEAAILKLIKGILGGDGSLQDKLSKVNSVCAKYGMGGTSPSMEGKFGPDQTPQEWKTAPDVSGADGGPVDGGAKSPARPARESVEQIIASSPLVKELRESLAEEKRLRLEDRCRKLLESANRAVDDFRIKTLAKLGDDDERNQLIESWTEKSATLPSRRPAQSFPMTESYTVTLPKDAESLARALR